MNMNKSINKRIFLSNTLHPYDLGETLCIYIIKKLIKVHKVMKGNRMNSSAHINSKRNENEFFFALIVDNMLRVWGICTRNILSTLIYFLSLFIICELGCISLFKNHYN